MTKCMMNNSVNILFFDLYSAFASHSKHDSCDKVQARI